MEIAIDPLLQEEIKKSNALRDVFSEAALALIEARLLTINQKLPHDVFDLLVDYFSFNISQLLHACAVHRSAGQLEPGCEVYKFSKAGALLLNTILVEKGLFEKYPILEKMRKAVTLLEELEK